jgi:hypothetical protein
MPEVPAVWAAPGAPASDAAATAAIRPAAAREPEPRGHEGLRPIPLRPLSVLELIDGAIGAVRAVPAALLGWVSLTVVAAALADFALTWAFDAAVAGATRVHPLVQTDDLGNTVVQFGKTSGAGSFGVVVVSALMPIVLSGFAVTILAGLIAEPVKQYVDGATTAAPTQPRQTRDLLRQLTIIAAVTALPRAIVLALCALVTLAVVNDPNGSSGVLFVFLALLGVPLCAWLTADCAVAAPVAALENTAKSFAALGRARRLVSGGRWRTLWATLLTLVISILVVGPLIICGYYIGSVHGVRDLLNGDPVSGATYWWLAGYIVVVALSQVLTAPFRAAVATMLYVDRRFRREGLDIRIAWARVARSSGSGKGR